MNPNIVNKEPGTGSLLPIFTFETLVYQNKELVFGSRFPIPCFRFYSFEIFETFSQIRNKEQVAGSRFPVISFILIYAPSKITSQYSLYADK